MNTSIGKGLNEADSIHGVGRGESAVQIKDCEFHIVHIVPCIPQQRSTNRPSSIQERTVHFSMAVFMLCRPFYVNSKNSSVPSRGISLRDNGAMGLSNSILIQSS